MDRNLLRRKSLGLTLSVVVGILANSTLPVMQAQNPAAQYPQSDVGARSMAVENQCQNAVVDRVSADAGRRITVQLYSKNFYPVSSTQQDLRGQLRYLLGPSGGGWRSATYDCVVNVRNNRVERATYNPRAGNGGNWPGPGPLPGPGVGNYPRVTVDTSGRGLFNASFASNAKITRGWVDTKSGRASVAFSGGNFRITFYGVVESTDGNRQFTMRVTGSDRGDATGRAEVRLNGDRNEVEMINVRGESDGAISPAVSTDKFGLDRHPACCRAGREAQTDERHSNSPSFRVASSS